MDSKPAIDSEEVLKWLTAAPVDLSFPTRQRLSRNAASNHDRRHACTECGARFRERKNLVAHCDEVHRKRRKFGCKHARCNVVSNRRYNMHRHERLMHARPCRTPCGACGNAPLALPPECIPSPRNSSSSTTRLPTSHQQTPQRTHNVRGSSSTREHSEELMGSSRSGSQLKSSEWFDGTLAPLEEVEAMFEMEAMFKHFLV